MITRVTTRPIAIPYDSLTLHAVVKELSATLIGGQIQDVRQPEQTELQLAIRNRGQNHLLQLSADAQFARVHLTSHRSANAPIPSAFCMALRRRIEGGRIRAVRQVGFDRIFEISITGFSSPDLEPDHLLIAELMGKHSNLILIDPAGRIVDSAKRIPHKINRIRETLPGLPYQLPPHSEVTQNPWHRESLSTLLLNVTQVPPPGPEDLAGRLRTVFPDLSPFLAQEIALRVCGADIRLPQLRAEFGNTFFPEDQTLPDRLQALWKMLFPGNGQQRLQPVRLPEAQGAGAYPIPLIQFPADAQQPAADLNLALNAGYTHAIQQNHVLSLLGALRGNIDRAIKRQERLQQSMERTLAEAHRAEEYKQSGELLLANLRQWEPGAESMLVTDYYDPEQREKRIALDPKLSPQENADAYFRRYRKARDGQEIALSRGMEAEQTLSRLRTAQAQVARMESAPEVDEQAIRQLQAELIASHLLQPQKSEGEEKAPRKANDYQGHKIRGFTTPEGYEIYLGETATANDYLTTRLAASDDLWLHVRAAPSAHVVIRTHGKPDQVPPSVLHYAARLCAQHSSQKHSSLVPVDYTLKKYVRKPRGSAPGSVQIRQEKTLHISPKEE